MNITQNILTILLSCVCLHCVDVSKVFFIYLLKTEINSYFYILLMRGTESLKVKLLKIMTVIYVTVLWLEQALGILCLGHNSNSPWWFHHGGLSLKWPSVGSCFECSVTSNCGAILKIVEPLGCLACLMEVGFISPSPYSGPLLCEQPPNTPAATDRGALSCLPFYNRLKLLWNHGLKIKPTMVTSAQKWPVLLTDSWCGSLEPYILVQKTGVGIGPNE